MATVDMKDILQEDGHWNHLFFIAAVEHPHLRDEITAFLSPLGEIVDRFFTTDNCVVFGCIELQRRVGSNLVLSMPTSVLSYHR